MYAQSFLSIHALLFAGLYRSQKISPDFAVMVMRKCDRVGAGAARRPVVAQDLFALMEQRIFVRPN